jgi:hypothetical protein
MGTTLRRVASLFVVCSLSVGVGGPASAVITDPQRAHRAMAYVGAQQQANGSFPGFSAIGSTADAVLDMAATGYGAEAAAIAFLRRQVHAGHVTTIGLTAKVVMAAVAAGRDPSTFAGTNLLGHIIDAERPSGRYGDASVFDQALAMLAIKAAGQTPDAAAVTWLANAQCPDGGWQFDRPHRASENRHCHDVNDAGDFFRSDTNTTAYAVMALEGLGASLASDPFPFFAALRDATYGGWGYTWGFRRTDANSTALVIQAFAAHGRPLPKRAMSGLRKLRYRCGAVAYSFTDAGRRTGKDVGASIGAVLGYLREPLPVTPIALGPPWATMCGP